MIPAVLIVLLWLAVVWRVWLTLRADVTHARRSLTVGLGFFAATATAWVYGHAINSQVGVPNLSTLLVRLALGACWIASQSFVVRFLYARLGPESPARPRRWVIVTTVFMMGSCAVLWALAPLHDDELQTLDAAADVWTTLLIVISYAWVSVLLAELMIASIRAFRVMRADPPGRVSAVFLGLTGLLGLIGIALLALERVLFIGADAPSVFGVAGGAVMPVVAATTALGMLAVPALEWVLAQVAARRQIRALQPSWLTVCRQRPELIVRLPRWTHIMDAPLVAERMRIELADAAD